MNTPPAALPVRRPRRTKLSAGAVIGILLAFLLMLAVYAAAIFAANNQQYLVDQGRIWNSTPEPAIAGYVDRSTMTEHGEFLLLASVPQILDPERFDEICSSDDSDFGTLGCYLPRTKQIFLYDVTDERLDGLEEVVASHEMLHAAWDRMSAEERGSLTEPLEHEAAKLSEEEGFAARMAFYAETEPGERLNELHSIIGTEVPGLSDELEEYYSRFFDDRATVVDLHTRSNAVFVDLKERSESLAAEMESLRLGIETDYAAYTAGYEAIGVEIDEFNKRARDGDFASQSQFDGERDALLGRTNDLDALFADIQERNERYDSLRAQLVELGAEAEELNKSINIEPKSGDTP